MMHSRAEKRMPATRSGHAIIDNRAGFQRHIILLLFTTILSFAPTANCVFLQGSETSHLRYPKWNTCSNSSISFDIRTTQPDGLLLYIDDGGLSDFLEVSNVAGHVRAVIRISDVRTMTSHIAINDGRWHNILIQRNGPQTSLVVDGISDSSYSFGADLSFGLGPQNNSYVFIGGLPSQYSWNLNALSLPSAFYRKRFNGFVRNVLYRNCTCMRQKVRFLDGAGYVDLTEELCHHYSCPKGCLCLSLDTETKCDCADKQCVAGVENNFELTFDALEGNILLNSSDVNASIHGLPVFERGIHGRALLVGGGESRVRISGAECLGGADACPMGFTLSFWVNFLKSCDRDNVILSNTDPSLRVPGIVMLYSSETLTVSFRKNGMTWQVAQNNVLSGWWHHVALTWHTNGGLTLYVNGEFGSFDGRPTATSPGRMLTKGTSRELVLGCPFDGDVWCDARCVVLVDDFNFRSKRLASKEIKESGPLFCYQMPMDSTRRLQAIGPSVEATVHGGMTVPGKIGDAMQFSSTNDYIDGGDHTGTCLGNLLLCRDGLTISMWIQLLRQAEEGFVFLSTGAKGLRMFYASGELVVVAQMGTRYWQVSWEAVAVGRWYFVEVSWNPLNGIQLFVDLKLAVHLISPAAREPAQTTARLYIGRSNAEFGRDNGVNPPSVDEEAGPLAAVDQVIVCYGERNILEAIDFIHRGRPTKYTIDMDAIVGKHLVLIHSPLTATAEGNPLNVPGKINNATRLDGYDQYIDLGYHGDSCLGNLMRCRHGFTGSMWAKFRVFLNGMYFLSSGGGVKIYFLSHSLNFVFTIPGKRWEVKVPAPSTDVWHFLEYSWSPEGGLKVYINNQLLGEDGDPDFAEMEKIRDDSSVRIGYANEGDAEGAPFRSGNFLVDETEFWFSSRDTLLAFGHLARENITHITVAFDGQMDSFNFTLHNGATLVPSQFGDAVDLKGNREYAALGNQRDSCSGNLETCSNGLTINFFINFRSVDDNAYVLSSSSYDIYVNDAKLVVEFFMGGKAWTARSRRLETGKWYRVDISWDEDKGLQLYLDKFREALVTEPRMQSRSSSDHVVYIGRSGNKTAMSSYVAPNALIDQIEFWYANRDHVRAFGFLEDDINGLSLNMERIENDLLFHQTHVVYVHGSPKTVPTRNGNGILLNGLNQYLDIGKDVACKGNLENCPKGFTLRFSIRPIQLLDNTYFVSSAPVDVFYQNGRLIAKARTPVREWSVSTPSLELKAWTQVDVSWDPVEGLILYINKRLVDQDPDPVTNEVDYNATKRFLIGRANTNMRQENYANAMFDDVEFWEANRSRLIKQGHIDTSKEGKGGRRRTEKAIRTTSGPATRRPTTAAWPTLGPPNRTLQTNAFYVRIPTGKAIRTTTSRWGMADYEFFPTLPPNAKKMLVFDGRSYVAYDVSQFPDNYLEVNGFEQLRMKFKTTDPNGLLWYSGNEDRNLHFSIKGGSLLLVVNYDDQSDVEKFRVAPPGLRLDDNEWHDVYITRNDRHVTIRVDGDEYPKMLANNISLINLETIFIAGNENTRALTNSHMRNNFHGTLDKVVFSGDTLPSDINLIDVAFVKPTPPYIEIYGNVNSIPGGTDAATASEPGAITFTQERSYLRLPLWDAELQGSLEFHFRTVEPHGLILYNGGQPSRRDFFAVELYDGILHVVIDLGSGVYRYRFTTEPRTVNDGTAHYLRIERIERTMKLTLDKEERQQNLVGGHNPLNLGTFLFLGAVDNPNRLPWHLWTRNPKYYVGCIWGMRVNEEELIDLPGLAVEQKMTGIEPGCRTKPLECAHAPCVNGVCADRWNGATCRCEETAFTGKLCHEPATLVAFTGNELATVALRPVMNTHTNDFSTRFNTPRSEGFLFQTTNRASSDYLKAFLDDGHVKLETNLGGQLQSFQMTIRCEMSLSDGQWHTLHIQRRANFLSGWVDDCSRVTAESPGEGYTLDIDQLSIARESSVEQQQRSFVGHMQNFMFGPYNVFELLGANQPPGMTVESTGEITPTEIPIPLDPVMLRLYSDAFVAFGTPATYNVTLSLMFKTTEPYGLLMFRAGLEKDFLGLELVNGQLHVASDEGSGTKEATLLRELNNNDWHVVSVTQPHPKRLHILLDQTESTTITFPNSSQSLDLTGHLYVGGIPEVLKENMSSAVASRVSFAGCLASVFIDGQLVNLMTDSINPSGLVTPGCTDVKGFCGPSVCKHFGQCKEAVNDFFCDCNLTSFVGKTCEDEPEGYRFGYSGSRGLATLLLSPRPETDEDVLAFGFMTWHPQGTLVRTESRTNAHYIEAKLENGHVVVEFDIGNEVERLVAEDTAWLNDSEYHTVLFEHSGMGDDSLRVDDYQMTRITSDSDARPKLLNEMSTVKIGGNINSDDVIVDHFDGIIAGVYFNGMRVIDMGVYDTNKEQMTQGDIILATHPFTLPEPSDSEVVRATDEEMPPIGQPTSNTDVGTSEPEMDANEEYHHQRPIPSDIGGGGIGWKMVEQNEGMVVILLPDKRGGGGIHTRSFDAAAPDPIALPVVGGSGPSRVPSGRDTADAARAGAVAGTMLCLLAAATSIIWALYKFKPSQGTGRAYRPASTYYTPGMTGDMIPTFVTTSASNRNLPASRLPSATFRFDNGTSESIAQTYLSAVGGIDLSSGFSSLSATHVSNAGSGIAGVIAAGSGSVTRGTQTDLTSFAVSQFHVLTPPSSASVTETGWNSLQPERNGTLPPSYGTVSLATVQTQTSDYPDAIGSIFDGRNPMAANGVLGYGSGYDESLSSTTISYPSAVETGSTIYHAPSIAEQQGYRTLSPQLNFGTMQSVDSYHMESMATNYAAGDGWNQDGGGGGHVTVIDGATEDGVGGRQKVPCLAAEVIRVDCVLLTTNGRYVVTGSIYGPPQVWDMKTGELVKVMTGNDLSSTDLHLAGGDSLLVGQVADIAPVEDNTLPATPPLTPRVLQIWDFSSGNPLNMPSKEPCTASCLMPDGERIALARATADPPSSGITVTVWDLPGNQLTQSLHLDVIMDPNTHVNHVMVSDDGRYVTSAYQDPSNGRATFVVFDLLPNHSGLNSGVPKVVTLNAVAKVSAALDDHEVVTGTRKGELVIWNMSSGKVLRQLLQPSTGSSSMATRRGSAALVAHQLEVKALAVSSDHLYLVSASADQTLNLWHLETERLRFQLTGHTDEVTCCSFSYDSELIASGSMDCTIRLWRSQDGLPVAVFPAGVDVFKVLVSNNKRTVVALGDRSASRKLIMLQIVRSKTKSRSGSQATSSPIALA